MVDRLSSLSIVIPVYRAGNVVIELHSRLVSVMNKICVRYEIIFVEDDGGDNSWQLIEQLASEDGRVRGIRMARNFGQHNALLCGIRMAQCDFIVTMDDDLQNPPEEIVKLVAKMLEGYDVVYGTPARGQHGMLRNIGSRITKLALQSVMGAETARNISAFRIFKTDLRRSFEIFRGPFVNIDVLLSWATKRFASITVRHSARTHRISGYTLGMLIRHALNMMTGFSVLPLRFASIIGFVFMLFGAGVLVYVVVRYFTSGNPVPGFPFLASIIVIFSGAQLFALGVIGEYLARIHFRSMDKPAYVVGEETLPLESR